MLSSCVAGSSSYMHADSHCVLARCELRRRSCHMHCERAPLRTSRKEHTGPFSPDSVFLALSGLATVLCLLGKMWECASWWRSQMEGHSCGARSTASFGFAAGGSQPIIAIAATTAAPSLCIDFHNLITPVSSAPMHQQPQPPNSSSRHARSPTRWSVFCRIGLLEHPAFLDKAWRGTLSMMLPPTVQQQSI